jgi:hypothetical protein
MTRIRLALIALGLAGAAPAFGQQVLPPAPPAAPVALPIDTKQPLGATIRCADGSWIPAGGAVTVCDTHKGIAFRLPEKTPPPPAKTRPDAGATKIAPPPAPQGISAPVVTSSSVRSTANANAPKGPIAPPADATLACMDGTFLTGAADASRCQAYGGLSAILPKKRP